VYSIGSQRKVIDWNDTNVFQSKSRARVTDVASSEEQIRDVNNVARHREAQVRVG